MFFYTGDILKLYKNRKLGKLWKERLFVEEIRKYLRAPYGEPLIISGLRGTGKTAGALQAIPDDACYILHFGLNDSDGFEEFLIHSWTSTNNCSCFVIDNFDYFADRTKMVEFMKENKDKYKFILIQETPEDSTNLINVNHIELEEFARIEQRPEVMYSKYLLSKGFFADTKITDPMLYLNATLFPAVYNYLGGKKLFDLDSIRDSVVKVLRQAFLPEHRLERDMTYLDKVVFSILEDMDLICAVRERERNQLLTFVTSPCLYNCFYLAYGDKVAHLKSSPNDILKGQVARVLRRFGKVYLGIDHDIFILETQTGVHNFICKSVGEDLLNSVNPSIVVVTEPGEEQSFVNSVSVLELEDYLNETVVGANKNNTSFF